MTLREYRPSDLDALTLLWCAVFGDSVELVESFFSCLEGMGTCFVAEEDGSVVGMSSVITGCGLICPDGTEKSCAYIYALAVDENRRHEGIGSRLTAHCVQKGRELGAEIVCTLPAEDELYPFYEKYMGTAHILRREKKTVNASPAVGLTPVSAETYLEKRELLLSEKAHMRPALSLVKAQSGLCACLGGGLFAFDGGICCGYSEDEALHITELICRDGSDTEKAAASFAFTMNFGKAFYYVPVSTGGEKYVALDSHIDKFTVWNFCLD